MTHKPRAAGPETAGPARGGSAPDGPENGQADERVVIRDKRKIDVSAGKAGKHAEDADAQAPEPTAATGPEQDGGAPVSTEGVAPGGGSPVASSGALGAELEALRAELEERTRDVQRVSAEYANYRKRVDRDRGVAAEQTTATVLGALLPILDDLDRAREHGDLVGPFGTVAEQLTAALGKFGLTAFGEKGDPFDPTRHEAVAHLTSPEVTEPTCIDVMRRGYQVGDRLLRPALVAVADPE
ncbi:molecular chaperone GrpE [Micromonospora pattaloongensis]|uniref:Protein GrpE n=1 Tax=Micromonospora pattaloongensis TaxID=405436 RepID=A0A1H3I3J3_9ACTN|nr:nucleotide exchange factor GrpE [Micromonospora pattaloongensis]SDY22266.1 molecular chaperone GrpE [Micromonospora pattaloongensis]